MPHRRRLGWLDRNLHGVVSALNDTSRGVGGAIGVALLGSILSSGSAAAIKPALADLPVELSGPASEGIGNAFGVAAQAGDAGPMIIDAAKHAFVDGWVRSMWVGVAMVAFAVVLLIVRGPVDELEVEAIDELEAGAPVPTA